MQKSILFRTQKCKFKIFHVLKSLALSQALDTGFYRKISPVWTNPSVKATLNLSVTGRYSCDSHDVNLDQLQSQDTNILFNIIQY